MALVLFKLISIYEKADFSRVGVEHGLDGGLYDLVVLQDFYH